MPTTNKAYTITDQCIWLANNRPQIRRWLSTNPTLQGVTYSPEWLDSLEPWVQRQQVLMFGEHKGLTAHEFDQQSARYMALCLRKSSNSVISEVAA